MAAKAELRAWRESYANHENAALEKAGRPERVDHRSLKDRSIDQIPQPKIGKEATAMKRKGILEDPERFKVVRKVKLLNDAMPFIRAIQRHGELQHCECRDHVQQRERYGLQPTRRSVDYPAAIGRNDHPPLFRLGTSLLLRAQRIYCDRI